MIYYHGTSSVFLQSIKEKGLIPGINLCEARKRNLDKIFFTDCYEYAKGYAIRAVIKFGGEATVIAVTTELKTERIGRVNQYYSTEPLFPSMIIQFPLSAEPIDEMVKIFTYEM